MNHINELKGIGVGRKCLLIGNGFSADPNNFPWNRLGDVYKIGMNKTDIDKVDMIVYYDRDMAEYYTENELPERIKLVGYKHRAIDRTCPRCNYYYTKDDILFGDTGFHLLQMADRIFQFDEINLVGYDYNFDPDTYHWNEKDSDRQKLVRFAKHAIRVVQRYYKVYWKHKVYNLGRKDLSALEAFEYKTL